MVRALRGDNLSDAIGNYVIFSNKDNKKFVGKVIEVDENKLNIRYEIISGQDKGMLKSSKYLSGRPFKLYTEHSLIKALLEV
jgi:hypothetical protein